eukprot:1728617-Alexandrium_andersonii.AAC.1
MGALPALPTLLEVGCWDFGGCPEAGSTVRFFYVHCVCLAHQLSLCSRSQFAYIGGSLESGKKFINGLTGLCHVMSRSSYMTRIFLGVWNLVSKVKVMPVAEAPAVLDPEAVLPFYQLCAAHAVR